MPVKPKATKEMRLSQEYKRDGAVVVPAELPRHQQRGSAGKHETSQHNAHLAHCIGQRETGSAVPQRPRGV